MAKVQISVKKLISFERLSKKLTENSSMLFEWLYVLRQATYVSWHFAKLVVRSLLQRPERWTKSTVQSANP
jgi:hypothetical protein